jgi:broad specificity phosphatase PhoE
VRHGQSEANERGLVAGRVDPALTVRGESQALSLVDACRGVEVVFASPLSRARRTAELATPGRHIEISDDFIELDYGRFDGRVLAELSSQDWREISGDYEHLVGGGESLAQLDARVHRGLNEIFHNFSDLVASPDRHVAVFAHASPVKSAAVWALGVHGSVAWRMRSDNCALTSITRRGDAPYLVSHNVPPGS